MHFRNLTLDDLDFSLNLIKIENWGTTFGEFEDLLLFSPNCVILAIMRDIPVGMIFTVSYDN